MRLLLLTLLIFSTAHSQNAVVEFKPRDYPDSAFAISRNEYPHGSVCIQVIQVKRITPPTSKPFYYCRAWLNVLKNSKVMTQRYFDDIEPVGSYYGLCIPEQMPAPNYFAVVKYGDYDGKLFLINKEGLVREYFGGPFVVSIDRKYLFSSYHSDSPGIEVVRLSDGKSICRSSLSGDIEQILSYRSAFAYRTSGIRDSLFVWNAEYSRFVSHQLDSTSSIEMRESSWDFVPSKSTRCDCSR